MPYINGRYHVNPAMGQALDAARESEAALLALQQQASRDSAGPSGDDSCDPDDRTRASAAAGTGPVHHVEIEVTEIVPSSSGRAVRGFVARVHRMPGISTMGAWAQKPAVSPTDAPPPETHVFADHRDLVDFLRHELAKK